MINTNWTLGKNYYTPVKGEHVWYWPDGDTANSSVVKDVRMVEGLPEVFLGQYTSNSKGKEFIKSNRIYLNEFMGNNITSLNLKFTPDEISKYFDLIWVSCQSISHPDTRNQRFIQKASFVQLLNKLNQLKERDTLILNSIKECFPLPECTVGYQRVTDENYNKLVKVING
jgi:hypothetical protein